MKRLDQLVQSSGVPESLIAGIIGCLIFGVGMCLCLNVIGGAMWLGILLGLIGTVSMILAYPIYRQSSQKSKAKYTHRILELAAELTGEISF